jgi:glycine cleavage system H protein
VDPPEVGEMVEAGADCAVVESVKAASDVYSPVTGEVVAINDAIQDAPETINEDAFGDGWLFQVKLSDPSELEGLLDADSYAAMIEEED